MDYVDYTLNFVSSGAPVTLTFQSEDIPATNPWGPVVSDVSVAAVPEPATWAMMLVGFFGVGFMIRGSRRKDALAVA
jgi:hypothetical protein